MRGKEALETLRIQPFKKEALYVQCPQAEPHRALISYKRNKSFTGEKSGSHHLNHMLGGHVDIVGLPIRCTERTQHHFWDIPARNTQPNSNH